LRKKWLFRQPFEIDRNLQANVKVDTIRRHTEAETHGAEKDFTEVEDLFARIGNNIRKYRKARGMTQEQLAEASELSAYFVGSIERGPATVSVRSLEQVARALRVPLRDLFQFSEDVGREDVLREVIEYARGASLEELRVVVMLCRLIRRAPPTQARG